MQMDEFIKQLSYKFWYKFISQRIGYIFLSSTKEHFSLFFQLFTRLFILIFRKSVNFYEIPSEIHKPKIKQIWARMAKIKAKIWVRAHCT